jgi:hypothetical protein
MSVQIVTNAKGEKTGVLVPYKEWDALNKEREGLKRKLQEAELMLRYKKAFNDAACLNKANLRPIQ